MSEDRLLEFMSSTRSSQDTSDILIYTNDNQSFLATRLMLVYSSPFFDVLLNGPFKKEKKLERQQTSTIYLNMTKDELYPVLARAMYGEGEINDKNVKDMIKVADFLGISTIVEECELFLEKSLNTENVVELYMFALDYFFINLKASALNFILNNFSLVKESSKSGILNLPEAELIEILSDHGLRCSEEDVWKFILSWNRANNTEPSLALLLTARFGRMDIQFFRREVALHPFIEKTGLMDIIDGYEELVANLENCTTTVRTPSFAMPRDSQEYIFSFGGWSTGAAVSDIAVYIPGFEVWVNLETQLPSPWAYMEGVYHDGSVYLCGGHLTTGDWATREVWKLDLKTLNMQEVCRMQESRNYIGVTASGNYMYAVGGNDQNSRLISAERYDFSTNQWFLLPNMKKERSDAAVVNCCGKVYVIGGFDGHRPTNTCEVYDQTMNKWRKIQAMKTCRSGVKGIGVGDRIYVVGGWDGFKRLDTCEVYIPKERRWTRIPSMSTPRSNHSLEFIDGKLFAIGGFDGDGTTANVEAYDIQSQKWTAMCKLPSKRSALFCVTVPAGALNQELVRQLETKVQYLERKRIALRREVNSRLRLQLLDSIEDLNDEDEGVHLVQHEEEGPVNLENNDENEDVVDIEDMLNVANMLGMVGNAIGEQNQQFDEEIDSNSDSSVDTTTSSSSDSEDEGLDDGDWADLPLLLQENVLMDFNLTDSDDDDDWN